MAFALLRAFFLKVEPHVLLDLGALLLHLNLVRVLESFHLLALLLAHLIVISGLHSKVFRKLKLGNCRELLTWCPAHRCTPSGPLGRRAHAHLCLRLLLRVRHLLILGDSDIVHGDSHLLAKVFVAHDEAHL